VSADNSLVVFYDIHGRKRGMQLFCPVLDSTRELLCTGTIGGPVLLRVRRDLRVGGGARETSQIVF
jgi:hypothetical protein